MKVIAKSIQVVPIKIQKNFNDTLLNSLSYSLLKGSVLM